MFKLCNHIFDQSSERSDGKTIMCQFLSESIKKQNGIILHDLWFAQICFSHEILLYDKLGYLPDVGNVDGHSSPRCHNGDK